ncbi:AraC family transcriptional regulator [Alcanivorax sp.]|uniref:AraC family transcriptional regulator n=1 Tax=Alcanivorax sp. TaxID=1872427 RepID=UPI00262D8922|nr:AraC family transcriptional regulator [Alcanivorax sp.]
MADKEMDRLKPAIHPTYSRVLCAHLKQEGFSDADIFSGTRLAWQELLSEHRYLSLEQLSRLIRRALLLTAEPWIGLKIGANTPVSAHGALGYAVVSAPDMRTLLSVVARFVGVRLQLVQLKFEERDGWGQLRLHENVDLGDCREFLLGALLGTYFQMTDAVSTGRTRDARVQLPFPRPLWAEHYERLLGCSVNFDADGFLVEMPPEQLASPCLTADPAMHRNAIRDCEHQLKQLEKGGPFSQQVSMVLLDCQGELPSLEVMAEKFAMSTRTLIRKLKAEDTRYQQLLDDVRSEQAAWLLTETGMPIERIAERLGYQDTSNFSRTFRRWFQMTPLAMRKASQV